MLNRALRHYQPIVAHRPVEVFRIDADEEFAVSVDSVQRMNNTNLSFQSCYVSKNIRRLLELVRWIMFIKDSSSSCTP